MCRCRRPVSVALGNGRERGVFLGQHGSQIEYHAIARGALYLYRDAAELDAGVKKMAQLAEHGQKQEILDARGVAQLDPVFEPVQGRIAGAIRDVGDSSGDSRLFVENLARVCREKLGVVVKLGTRVSALRGDTDRIGAKILGGLLTNILASPHSMGLTSVVRPAQAAGRSGVTCAHCGFNSAHERAFYCPKCGMRLARG